MSREDWREIWIVLHVAVGLLILLPFIILCMPWAILTTIAEDEEEHEREDDLDEEAKKDPCQYR